MCLCNQQPLNNGNIVYVEADIWATTSRLHWHWLNVAVVVRRRLGGEMMSLQAPRCNWSSVSERTWSTEGRTNDANEKFKRFSTTNPEWMEEVGSQQIFIAWHIANATTAEWAAARASSLVKFIRQYVSIPRLPLERE